MTLRNLLADLYFELLLRFWSNIITILKWHTTDIIFRIYKQIRVIFQHCFYIWLECWNVCLKSESNSFEDDQPHWLIWSNCLIVSDKYTGYALYTWELGFCSWEGLRSSPFMIFRPARGWPSPIFMQGWRFTSTLPYLFMAWCQLSTGTQW